MVPLRVSVAPCHMAKWNLATWCYYFLPCGKTRQGAIYIDYLRSGRWYPSLYTRKSDLSLAAPYMPLLRLCAHSVGLEPLFHEKAKHDLFPHCSNQTVSPEQVF